MNNDNITPLFIESMQVRATAKAGVFISMQTDKAVQVFAPLSSEEAQRLAEDLLGAVAAYEASETAANANAS